MEFLTNAVKTLRVIDAQSAGTTTVNSDVVDTANFEGVRFVVAWGTITDGSPSVKAQQGKESDGSDMADLEGTSISVGTDDDNKLTIIDIYRPRERYVRAVVTRGGTTGSAIDGAIAELYDARKRPITQSADVQGSETHASPAEGTA